jgi:hypothetical protein
MSSRGSSYNHPIQVGSLDMAAGTTT